MGLVITQVQLGIRQVNTSNGDSRSDPRTVYHEMRNIRMIVKQLRFYEYGCK